MKSCKKGYYYCNKDEKCKKIPKGWHLMPSGYIMRDKDHEDKDEEKKKNGNGHHSNGNGDGSGESNGGSNGGGDGGGGVAEGWSAKYKKSIDCNNPKGFSQRAHCRGRKKMNEAKNGDHEVAMAQSQLAKAERNIAKLRKALGKKEKDIPAWMQAKITDTAHDTDAAAGYVDKIDNVQEAVPLLAAPLAIPASKAIGAGLAATGLTGLIMQARKKSEDKKSQSADYGQEKPAKKKDETEEGITGLPIPKKKWKSPTKRKKFEDARREAQRARGEFEKLGDNFSRHRMTGSRGHGSQYEVNPRITYRHNEEVEHLEEARDGKSAKDKGYSLRDWFKGGGWVQAGGKYDGKPCAKQPGQKTKPFCRDADDRAKMPKDEIERRFAKKNAEDPNPNRKGKAKMVSASYSNWRAEFLEGYRDDGDVIRPTDRIKMLDGKVKTLKDIDKKIENKKKPLQKEEVVSEKKDACYHKVKSRYSVWPSAYASGALVKCRKVGAKNWGNKTKKEDYDYSNWRDDFKAMEFEVTDLIKPEPMKGLSEGIPGYEKYDAAMEKIRKKNLTGRKLIDALKSAGALRPKTVNEAKLGKCEKNKIEKYVEGMKKNKGSFKDNYGSDAKSVMYATATNMAKKACKEEFEVSEGKYSRGERYVKGTAPYRDPVTGESYPKEKYKKKVPIADQFSDWRSELDLQEKKMKNCGCGQNPCKTYGNQEVKEDWQKVNRGDDTDGMSQKAVNAYKRENPGSKLQTAVTEKKPSGKRAKRRKSFCARSNGQRKMHNIDCSKTPEKKICKARKRWNCE